MSERRRRSSNRTYEETNALQERDAYNRRDDHDQHDDYDRLPPQPRGRSYEDGYSPRNYVPQPYTAPPPINVFVNNASTNTNTNTIGYAGAELGKSRFDGKLSQLIAWSILGILVTVFTFGICYPWALTMNYGWKINHTIIHGRRLKFTGSAVGLFGQWIKWLLLSIITLGIYTFWIGIKLEQWKVRNTTYAN